MSKNKLCLIDSNEILDKLLGAVYNVYLKDNVPVDDILIDLYNKLINKKGKKEDVLADAITYISVVPNVIQMNMLHNDEINENYADEASKVSKLRTLFRKGDPEIQYENTFNYIQSLIKTSNKDIEISPEEQLAQDKLEIERKIEKAKNKEVTKNKYDRFIDKHKGSIDSIPKLKQLESLGFLEIIC